MYERLSDKARRLVHFANQEAQQLDHGYVGTEHLLLAMIRATGTAGTFLRGYPKIKEEVMKLIKPGPLAIHMGKLPFTPRAKKVMECAFEESKKENSGYIGTEHILLGMFHEAEGVAGQVLMNLGIKPEMVYEFKSVELGPKLSEMPDPAQTVTSQSTDPATPVYLLGGAQILNDEVSPLRVDEQGRIMHVCDHGNLIPTLELIATPLQKITEDGALQELRQACENIACDIEAFISAHVIEGKVELFLKEICIRLRCVAK